MAALPAWPPSISQDDEQQLLRLSRDYALSHSVVYRPVLPPDGQPDVAFTTSVIHAPFALFPSPFPRRLFQLAQRIQSAYNALYAHIACDFAFLEKVIGGNVSKVDEFQGGLWKIAQKVREEGISQNIHLGLFRSDYLLHSIANNPPSIKQVEFNTISSSFGALSSKVTGLHQSVPSYPRAIDAYKSVCRFLAKSSQDYAAAQPPIRVQDLPDNPALQELATGLAQTHKAYNKPNSKILFVVQDPERNAFDQRALEWELLERHGVHVIRQSFPELHRSASLSASRELVVTSQTSSQATEISVVYFRAGYGPGDYPSQDSWDTRLLLERSTAIKCPSVALQLAGAKKVQQVLAERGVLESFAETVGISHEERDLLKGTFTSLYPLDDSTLGQEAHKLARTHPERFVLKPQREGGGNNVYRQDIPPFLAKLEEQDKARSSGEPKAAEGYILMDLIQPPEGLQNKLVRAGEPNAKQGEVVSELGIYGVALYEDKGGRAHMLENKMAGHLLRTKGRESDEGGVAVGFSVIDSPFLV